LWLTKLDDSRGADFPRPEFRIRRRLELSDWVPLFQLRFKPGQVTIRINLSYSLAHQQPSEDAQAYKKLSCRRQAMWRCVSQNISLKSLRIT